MPNEKTGNRKCWHLVAADGAVLNTRLTKREADRAAAFSNVVGTLHPKPYRACLDGHHFEPCPGEAHSNPHIDNCSLCAPNWGVVMVPGKPLDTTAEVR